MVRLIVFDLDGTLIEFNIPVEEIKKTLGINGSILEEIFQREDRLRCLQILEDHEIKCAKRSKLYPGVKELLKFLKDNGISTALYTRNSLKSVEINLKKHKLNFDFIFTREDDIKPSPYPVLHVMEWLKVRRNETVLIGDYYFDYLTAKNAGIEFWLYESDKAVEAMKRFSFKPDLRFNSFYDLIEILEMRINGN